MARETLTDRLINMLQTKFRCREASSASRKYRKFVNPSGTTYWVGRRGAVRVGRTVSKSISITEMMHRKLVFYELKSQNKEGQA